ncbi:hypothetical protein BB560_003370 [Smittium megazygosporum]|uniref:Uncharacterized protein n=1 Tax=Smittium megazygosporum TaxID=133381 RepID=A0A2T9ZC59_9FUNG|nr:hypothetical protein BB560_003370 [Smittium megazygosporum]
MPPFQPLENCTHTLNEINSMLALSNNSLSGALNELGAKSIVSAINKKHDITTLEKVEETQDLMSKQAIPFLYKQVDQLETILDKESLLEEQSAKEYKSQYSRLIEQDKHVNSLSLKIKNMKLELEEMQASFLEIQSSISLKDKNINLLQKQIDEKHDASVENVEVEKISKIKELQDRLSSYKTYQNSKSQLLQNPMNTDRLLSDIKNLTSNIKNKTSSTLKDNDSERISIVLDNLFQTVINPYIKTSEQHKINKHRYLSRMIKLFFPDQGECLADVIVFLTSKMVARVPFEELEVIMLEKYSNEELVSSLEFLKRANILSVFETDFEMFISLKLVNPVE